jgi:transcriptional regulator with XRE-family HTH domain
MTVIRFPNVRDHARASSRGRAKSLGVTAPPVSDKIATAKDIDGKSPLKSCAMRPCVTPTRLANASCVKPVCAANQSENRMADFISIADAEPSIALLMRRDGRNGTLSQNTAMAKKKPAEPKVPRFKKPKRRTFLPEWRKYRDNITQERLAERAGVSQGMISQLETGASDYSGELLEKLAYALNCEPADLIMRNPLDTAAPWSIWEQLKPEQRSIAIRFLKALREDEAA